MLARPKKGKVGESPMSSERTVFFSPLSFTSWASYIRSKCACEETAFPKKKATIPVPVFPSTSHDIKQMIFEQHERARVEHR
jgi:hypothetical protein